MQLVPVFLTKKSHGQRRLLSYTVRRITESDKTELLNIDQVPLISSLPS